MQEMTNHSNEARTEGIAVDSVDGQYRLLATRAFNPEDHILRLEGEVVDTPTRFSVQIGPDQHVDAPAELPAEETLHYPWRFLNHSCEPNAQFERRDLKALRTIQANEQITFDYNATEYDLASPFECQCGSDRCCGVVRGYRWQEDRAQAEG